MADILPSGLCPLGIGHPTYMDIQGVLLTAPLVYNLGIVGGIGFQLQGGVITVDGTSPDIRVRFDRPMVYDGTHSHVPTGKPYDIGAPVLAADARSLVIPITVAPSFLGLISITAPYSDLVVLTWQSPAVLLSNEGWIVSSVDGNEIQIISIRAGTAQTFITTTEQTAGATYSLYIPASCIFSYPIGSANDSLTITFIGGGTRVLTPIDSGGPSYSNPPPYEPSP